MTESLLNAKLVRVTFHAGQTGLFYAHSPDLKGLVVARHSMDDLPGAVTQAIIDLHTARGESVIVSHVDRDNVEDDEIWVVIPVESFRRALILNSSGAKESNVA